MPSLDGFALQEALARKLPHLSLVFVTVKGNIPMGVRAMKSGAVDLLEKPANLDVLKVVRQAAVRSREQKVSRAKIAEVQHRCKLLTPRERQVFRLITSGLRNKRAGAELGTSEKIIKVQRGQVMSKMRTESLAELVRMAELMQIHMDRKAD